MAKYPSKLKRNSKYNSRNKRAIRNTYKENRASVWKQCTSKKAYIDRASAGIARDNVRRKFGYNTRIYKCEICKYYHLTSEPKNT